MKKANVYFTNMRVRPEGRNLQQKLAFLIRRAGMDEIDFKDRFAAIKIHFGEARQPVVPAAELRPHRRR